MDLGIYKRIDRTLDLLDKWVSIYAFTHHPEEIAKAQAKVANEQMTNSNASKGYDEASNKSFGLKDRKISADS